MSIVNIKNDKSLTEFLAFTKQDGVEVKYGCSKENLDEQWSHAVLLAGLNRNVIAFENWTWWDVYMMENTTQHLWKLFTLEMLLTLTREDLI